MIALYTDLQEKNSTADDTTDHDVMARKREAGAANADQSDGPGATTSARGALGHDHGSDVRCKRCYRDKRQWAIAFFVSLC